MSKLDALKENFTTLMPFTKDATTRAKQHNKFFMIMELIGLPLELDSVCNQILLGSTLPNYDAISE